MPKEQAEYNGNSQRNVTNYISKNVLYIKKVLKN